MSSNYLYLGIAVLLFHLTVMQIQYRRLLPNSQFIAERFKSLNQTLIPILSENPTSANGDPAMTQKTKVPRNAYAPNCSNARSKQTDAKELCGIENNADEPVAMPLDEISLGKNLRKMLLNLAFNRSFVKTPVQRPRDIQCFQCFAFKNHNPRAQMLSFLSYVRPACSVRILFEIKRPMCPAQTPDSALEHV